MKQFFKFMFASMLGFLITFFIIFLILAGMIASLASFSKKDPVEVSANSVYHLKLNTPIVDRATDNPFEGFDFMSMSPTPTLGLNEILREIRKAGEDDNISGIFLDLTATQTGWSTLSEIRRQLLDFKANDKFIIAYGEYMTQGAYYLATAADEIYLSPEGIIDFRGLNAQIPFIKNMLEKLGIEAQIIRHGKYKSAGEPFYLDRLSAENREQIRSYVNSLWNSVLKDISDQRQLTLNELNRIADGFNTRTPELAVESRMIDGIMYRDEVLDLLKERLEIKEDKKLNLVNFARYKRAPLPESMVPKRSRDKVAVVYATGNIEMGDGSDTSIGSDRIAKALKEARRDTTVKAIVFRINSGGGSALASEVILREAMLAAEAKPLVVSMGDVAASGGYYIACFADEIFANPTTITGSIGVFGMIPNMKGFFNDKLGITFDNVKTNELADLGDLSRPLNRVEKQMIEQMIERVYDTFINHVAEGRDLPLAAVDSIAQGRVWSGVDAQRIGLIDNFGGLREAIEKAVELADLENYRIVDYPVRKDFYQRLLESFESVETRIVKARLGDSYPIYQQANSAMKNSGIRMQMPYEIIIE